jgi:hypothetical protein
LATQPSDVNSGAAMSCTLCGPVEACDLSRETPPQPTPYSLHSSSHRAVEDRPTKGKL